MYLLLFYSTTIFIKIEEINSAIYDVLIGLERSTSVGGGGILTPASSSTWDSCTSTAGSRETLYGSNCVSKAKIEG